MHKLIVDMVYYTLFFPLLMIPFVGWGVLIALGNYKERLDEND